MITINLLPEEFRVKEKNANALPALKIAIAAGSVLGVLTLFFYVDFWFSKLALGKLNKEWQQIQPQSQQLKQLQQEVEINLKPENIFLKRFVTAERPLTHILGWVSEDLPATAWIVEFNMERVGEGGKLLVKGLALPSKEKSSIEQIENYLNLLKNRMPDASLSLTTTRQTIKEVEVTQFIATFEWGIAVPQKL